MGTQAFDRYSLLHLASGIVSFYWGLSLILSLVVHTVFEVLENTKYGVYFIDNYLSEKALGIFGWPGGKKKPDTVINSVGDTIAFALGWVIAYAAWPSSVKFS